MNNTFYDTVGSGHEKYEILMGKGADKLLWLDLFKLL
jgi:hypothetical protein